jgi:hypothetical protein
MTHTTLVHVATRAEKRKWDGTLSSSVAAEFVAAPGDAVAWYVAAGSERWRSSTGTSERVAVHELWIAVPGEWWALCAEGDGAGDVVGYVLHAAAPFEVTGPELVSWIDLDLDFEVHGDEISLEDEVEFHEHARSMNYPDDVVRGAWAGISLIAPRYTTGAWPFDGWMERCLGDLVRRDDSEEGTW